MNCSNTSIKIGIDLDETIAATFEPVFAYAKNRYRFRGEISDICEHDWWESPRVNLTKRQVLDVFHDFYESELRSAILPVAGSVVACAKLKEKGALIIVPAKTVRCA